MILGFKKLFPWGAPTNFKEKILKLPNFRPKIHTLRESFRFKPGTLINFATGVRTENYFEFYRDNCKSTQTVVICNVPDIGVPFVYVDGRRLNIREREYFYLNDGFDSLQDFARWFNKPVYILQLIHWTYYTY